MSLEPHAGGTPPWPTHTARRGVFSRQALAAEIYRTTGLATQHVRLRRLLVAAALHRVRYSIGLGRLLSRTSRRRMLSHMRVAGADRLDAALARGSGLVLVSAHMGEIEIAAAWLVSRGADVVAVVAHEEARRQRLFAVARAACGVRLREAERTCLDDLLRDLTQGSVVVIMLDRHCDGSTVRVPFLGQLAELSVAPWALAARSGAPVLVGAMTGDGRRRIADFRTPVRSPASGPELFTAALAAELDSLVRTAPDQWRPPLRASDLPW